MDYIATLVCIINIKKILTETANLILISIVTSFRMNNNLDNSNSNQYIIKRAIPVSASMLSNFARFQGMVGPFFSD